MQEALFFGDQLGKGGEATVYSAQLAVAVKLPNRIHPSIDALQTEIGILAELPPHAHIVRAIGTAALKHKGCNYTALIMERCGHTLKAACE